MYSTQQKCLFYIFNICQFIVFIVGCLNIYSLIYSSHINNSLYDYNMRVSSNDTDTHNINTRNDTTSTITNSSTNYSHKIVLPHHNNTVFNYKFLMYMVIIVNGTYKNQCVYSKRIIPIIHNNYINIIASQEYVNTIVNSSSSFSDIN